jgi:hypothetical protein
MLITTKFIGPTNTRGSRIKATRGNQSKTIAWDSTLGIDENHARAAQVLIDAAEGNTFTGPIVRRWLPDGTCTHVGLYVDKAGMIS